MNSTLPTKKGHRPGNWLAGIVVGALLSAPSPPAAASHLALNFAQPVNDTGTVFYAAREAAHSPGDPDRFKIKGDLWIDNNGSSTLEVSTVTLSYPGSGTPSQTAPPVKPAKLPAGGTGRVIFAHDLNAELPVPLPPTINISVDFVESSHSFDVSFQLAFYENDTSVGSHIFPMAAADLLPGEYWNYETRHIDLGSTGRDRYGYDFNVVQWDGSGYTRFHLDGNGNPLDASKNENFLAFGKPIYAVADGTVVRCQRGLPDNDPPNVGDSSKGGGNELWIQHGDEVVRYAHMMQGSMPAWLCPDGDGQPHTVESQNIQVTAGQQIGQIGNNGQSDAPHLHITVHPRPDTSQALDVSFQTANAHPLNFHNIRLASDPLHINNLGQNPSLRPVHGRVIPSRTLILPNPCGLNIPAKGAGEIAYHGIDAGCHQDQFNLTVTRGYRPIFVDGYEAAGNNFFNATFRQAGPAWVARHGLTGSEYKTLFDDMDALGFRLQQVDAYRDGGGIRYAAIFVKQPGPPYSAFHGLDDDEFAAKLDSLASAGYVPVNVSPVEVGGQFYWTGLFEQVPTTGWGLETVPVGDYQSVFNSHDANGEILTYVHGAGTVVGPYITGVWVKPVGNPGQAVHGLTTNDYQNAYNANLGAGRLTRAVTGYDDGSGTQRFAAVWRGNPDTVITSMPPAVTNQSGATFEFEADNPFTTLQCELDWGGFGSCSSPLTYLLLGEGEHTFRARAVDRELLVDHSPAQFTWLVDLTPPEGEIVLPQENTKTVHGELKDEPVDVTTVVGWATVAAEATDALSGIDSVSFSVDGVPVPPGDVLNRAGSDVWQFRFEPDVKGEHLYQVSVTATDKAGNSTTDVLEILGVKTGKKPK